MYTKYKSFIVILSFVLLLNISLVTAQEINIANSRDWTDVYAVLLHSSFEDTPATFTLSESLNAITRVVPESATVNVFSSSSQPYVQNLHTQLQNVGYTVASNTQSNDFLLELDPLNGRYIVLAEESFRTAVTVIPYAIRESRWVLLVNSNNVNEVASRLSNADEVLAVGNFQRSILTQIEPFFTERINNNNIYTDTQNIADRFGTFNSVVITDGTALETEFFTTRSPVLLSGLNRIADQTTDYILSKDIRSVIIVGNRLAVVGDQIRERSNRTISVFIKFGQSDPSQIGTIYALSLFPLPAPQVGIAIEDVIYTPTTGELVVFYRNTGNVGVYQLSTVRLLNEGTEIAVATDDEVQFLGLGELLPVIYDVSSLNPTDVDENTVAEFFTSYGPSPRELDSFLTMDNRFGPPFSLNVRVGELTDDGTLLTLVDASYYPNLRRFGVTVANNGTVPAFYTVQVRNLIVNGLPQDFSREEQRAIQPGEVRTTFFSVTLDEVDMIENTRVGVTVLYGAEQALLVRSIREQVYFRITETLNMVLWGIIGGLTFILIGMIMVLFMFRGKRSTLNTNTNNNAINININNSSKSSKKKLVRTRKK